MTDKNKSTMSDKIGSSAANEPTIGATLRSAREAKSMTVEQIAERLKVRGGIVIALEAGRYDDLPEPIYTRAYLERYAQIVEVDAATIVRRYDRRAGFTAGQVVFVPKVLPTARSSKLNLAVPALILLGVAAIAGAAWWWQVQSSKPIGDKSAPTQQTPNNSLSAPISQGDPNRLLTVKISVSSTPSGASVMLDRFKIGVTPIKDAPVSGGAKRELRLEKSGYKPFTQSIALTSGRNFNVALTPVPIVTPTTAPDDGKVTLRFRGKSWLRVTDSSGKLLFEGIPEAGSSQVYAGPITVRAGRPDVISATAKGVTKDVLGGSTPGTFTLP